MVALPRPTRDVIDRANSASRKLQDLLDEQEERYRDGLDDKSRRYFVVDKARLEREVTAAAMALATAASRALNQIRATCNNDYWEVSPRERERESQKIRHYKTKLEDLSSDGLFSKSDFRRAFRIANRGGLPELDMFEVYEDEDEDSE
jgi:hypothetical protein